MSDASDAGYASLATTFLGGLTSAFGAFESGQDQKAMYDYQASVAKVNAQVASGATLTTICDDLVIVQANGNVESITVTGRSGAPSVCGTALYWTPPGRLMVNCGVLKR